MMDGHVDACWWSYGLLIVMIFYIVYNVTLEFIELWTFEYNDNNDISEIVIVYDNYSEIIIIYFDDTD